MNSCIYVFMPGLHLFLRMLLLYHLHLCGSLPDGLAFVSAIFRSFTWIFEKVNSLYYRSIFSSQLWNIVCEGEFCKYGFYRYISTKLRHIMMPRIYQGIYQRIHQYTSKNIPIYIKQYTNRYIKIYQRICQRIYQWIYQRIYQWVH